MGMRNLDGEGGLSKAPGWLFATGAFQKASRQQMKNRNLQLNEGGEH